jgi:glycosyltransferase involved in cell wall biosynthesis
MSRRIIIHTPEPVSSPARYIEELSRALTAAGSPVHVVCPANHQFRREMESNPRITVHPSAPRSTEDGRGLLSRIAGNLAFLISSCTTLFRNSRRVDIVHFQYPVHFPFGALAFFSAWLRGCRIVFTVHDPLPHKWLLPKKLRWLEEGSLAWAYKVSDTLVVHNEPGKRVLIDHFKQDPAKVTIIVHGPYELRAGRFPMPESSYFEVLLFGAIRENKGVHLAIEAAQQLHDEGVPVRLTIAGTVLNSKEQAYWERCSAMIESNPKPIRLMKEFIPDERLPELFAGCHCVLLPYTRFFSDSGVAFMALANARPIVATRFGGNGTLLDAADLGIAINEATSSSVAAAIRHAMSLGPEELDRKGGVGAHYTCVECGWPKVAADTLSIYDAGTRAIPEAALPLNA